MPCARCRRECRTEARGLCVACYQRVLHTDAIRDYPRVYRTYAELLEDYEDVVRTVGGSIADIAARLGCSRRALERARSHTVLH